GGRELVQVLEFGRERREKPPHREAKQKRDGGEDESKPTASLGVLGHAGPPFLGVALARGYYTSPQHGWQGLPMRHQHRQRRDDEPGGGKQDLWVREEDAVRRVSF